MKTLIVIPTYNECENIPVLIDSILKLNRDLNILVVDDNSPDGTGLLVSEISKKNPSVQLLSRPGKEGLGRAYIAGLSWGLSQNYDFLFEMDADFSHRPEDLLKLLDRLQDADFIVGSRYVPGGQTKNWGILRKIISRGGSLYSQIILGYPLQDWTGGFNGWSRTVLERIRLDTVKSNGYSFQIELKYRALKNGFKGIEVPILFEDRRVGQSKMSFKIVIEAFYRVWKIRFQ
ncbi:MAG: polyprenol monophosphomannose synthase [Bdellovibrionota bacterium]